MQQHYEQGGAASPYERAMRREARKARAQAQRRHRPAVGPAQTDAPAIGEGRQPDEPGAFRPTDGDAGSFATAAAHLPRAPHGSSSAMRPRNTHAAPAPSATPVAARLASIPKPLVAGLAALVVLAVGIGAGVSACSGPDGAVSQDAPVEAGRTSAAGAADDQITPDRAVQAYQGSEEPAGATGPGPVGPSGQDPTGADAPSNGASSNEGADDPSLPNGTEADAQPAVATLTEPQVPAETPQQSGDWRLILVNATHPIPDDYQVGELIELRNGQAVDKRIYPELQQMFDDCRAAGLDPYINSSYRSHETQQAIMADRIESYEWDGYSADEARALAESEVAIPGTSEHEIGFALDIMSEREDYDSNAEVRDWLAANGWRYGFILRYPEGKTDVTGIVGEPWHFRYVGVEAATAMHESGQCLEEYLGAV